MKILITGASGFIGSFLFKEFTNLKYETYGLVRKKPTLNFLIKNKKKIIVSDLTDFDTLNKLIPKKIDIIIHAGAYNDQDTNNDIKNSYTVNIYGTRNICQIANNRKVKKLIYFSVLQVYGRELIGRFNEKSNIICDNDYSMNHYLSEEVCRNHSKQSQVKFTILRLGYIFGCPIEKKIDRKTLIPFIFCDQVVKSNQINLMTKGNARRDFVSLTKLFLNLRNIFKDKDSFNIYNITSGYSFSIRQIVEMVKKQTQNVFKKRITVKYGNLKDKENQFKVFSKLSLYNNKQEISKELNFEINKIINLLVEK